MEGIHLAQIVGLANTVMMFCAMFALGLDQPVGGLVALWRQPSLLGRSLLATQATLAAGRRRTCIADTGSAP